MRRKGATDELRGRSRFEMEHSTKPDVAALENNSIDLKKSWSREIIGIGNGLCLAYIVFCTVHQ